MATFPGFDTGSYPGDNVMQKWFGNPFVFTGFYLEAPCHNASKFKPWSGHMAFLKSIGWGFVVVYVGSQGIGCGANSLSRARGTTDGNDAIAKAKAEGVANGGTIFLDVELMDSLSQALINYMRGWLAALLQEGTFKAGIYSHFRNAKQLRSAAQQEYEAQGQAGGAPEFFVVRVPGSSFNVNTSSPQDLNNFATNPISFASVWQGKIDVPKETHNAVKFGPVDEDVANSRNPSNA